MEINSYLTVASEVESIYVEKGSKFIGYTQEVNSVEICLQFEKKIQNLHPKARHICYAYRLGLNKNNFRANDAGEPSGTAGKPILSQIDSLQLSNTMVVVVRYFGGILLGTGGLIKAYKQSASIALQQAGIKEIDIIQNFKITSEPDLMYKILKYTKEHSVAYSDLEIADLSSINLHIPLKLKKQFFLKLKTLIENEEPNDQTDVYQIRNCHIETKE